MSPFHSKNNKYTTVFFIKKKYGKKSGKKKNKKFRKKKTQKFRKTKE
jgi:hypothetical protein